MIQELRIDLDLTISRRWIDQYRLHIHNLLERYGMKATSIKITKSRRRGYHVRIRLDQTIPDEKANMLQFLLCDDHERVDFNRARIQVGYQDWNKLFEKAR